MKLEQGKQIRGDIIFKVIVGSHAHGTSLPESDEDIKGVYIQSPEDVLIHGYQEQVEMSKDEVYYELRRFVDLCCTGNPTMMEVCFSPDDCIVYKHPIMDVLLTHKDRFLSKSCKWSYGGYAHSQISKASGLDKKMNWEKQYMVRKQVLDFCYIVDNNYVCKPVKDWLKETKYHQQYCGLSLIDHFPSTYKLYYDHVLDMKSDNPRFDTLNVFKFKGIVQDEENSNTVSVSEIPLTYKIVEGLLHFNSAAYSNHCKKFLEYSAWLEARNTQRYVDIDSHGQQIDGKNMLHCIRLIEMGKEIAEGKGLNVRRGNADYLISIRKGKVDLKILLDKAISTREEMDILFDKSTLPDKCDRGFFISLIVKMRQEYYVTQTA